MYQCSEERMKDKITTMSAYGDAGHGGITRYSLSQAAISARNEFIRRMQNIGCEIKTDDVANVYALSLIHILMSPHPGRLSSLVEVDLPRPRGLEVKDTGHFTELVAKVRNSFEGGSV